MKICKFCTEKFSKGHNCWCPDCRVVHPMCNKCYIKNKKLGLIKDQQMDISHIDKKNINKYT